MGGIATIKTLLVDDERSFLSQAEIFLDRIDSDIEVHTAHSAEKALEMMDQKDFDVIVSDYQMPDIDGLEFLERVRQERESDIPFIMFTGKGREGVAMKALNLGADRYIQKGGDPKSQFEVLVDAITQEYEHSESKRKLEKSERELKKSRKKYKKMFNETPLGAFRYDGEGVITECNNKFVEMMGSSRESLVGFDLLEDLENDELRDEVKTSLNEGEGYYEGKYTSVTGSSTTRVRVFLKGIKEDDQIGSGIALVEDITKRKESEEELKMKETFLDHTPIYITVIDEEGEIKYHSYPFNEAIGMDSNELIGTDAVEHTHPDDKEEFLELFSNVMENPGEEFKDEIRVESEEDWLWLEVRAINYLEDPDINGIIVTSQDINERKRIERKLKEREEKYRALVESAFAGIGIADFDNNLTFVNEKFAEMLGYEKEELTGKNLAEISSEEEQLKFEEETEKRKEGKTSQYETRLKKKSGETIETMVHASPFKNADGEIVGTIGIVTDITDTKELEKELKENQQKLKQLYEMTPKIEKLEDPQELYELIIDTAKNILDFNVSSVHIKEGEKLVVKASTEKDLVGKHSFNINEGVTGKTFRNKESYIIDEVRKEKDAKPTDSDFRSAISVPMGDIGVFQALSYERDYYDEKDLELAELFVSYATQAINRMNTAQALKESEKKFRTVIDNSADAIFLTDQEGNYTYVNQAACDLLGYTKEELERMNLGDLSREEDIDKHLTTFEQVLEEEKIFTEITLVRKDGTLVPVDLSAVLLPNGMIYGSARDITERMEMEEKLKESEKKYRRVTENINDGILLLDQNGEIIYGNKKPCKEILGYEVENIIGRKGFELFHPDDREKVMEAFEKGVENVDEEQRFEARVSCKDGSYKWIEASGRFLPDEEGEALVVYRDISERKKAERVIEEHQEKLERLHDISAELQTYDSEEDVYSFAVEAAENILDFDICSFDAVEEDKFVVKATSSGVPEGGVEDTKLEEGGIAGDTYLNQEPHLIDDVKKEKDADPVKSDYRSAISVPIGKQGVFQVASKETSYFDEEDLKMARLLANHISEALRRVKAKSREEFLHSLLRHDVGNKIQVIEGYIQLLQEDVDEEGPIKMIGEAEQATKEAQDLIEKVRTLRDVMAEEEVVALDICEILRPLVSRYEERAEDQEIELECEIEEMMVQGGPLLKEMFSNILENTIIHAECDKIRVSTEEQEANVIVKVEDDGKGIPDDEKDKLFERGYKKGDRGGSGLGLYLVKEIAKSYGGSVEVKDSEMSGARFDVRLKKADG